MDRRRGRPRRQEDVGVGQSVLEILRRRRDLPVAQLPARLDIARARAERARLTGNAGDAYDALMDEAAAALAAAERVRESQAA